MSGRRAYPEFMENNSRPQEVRVYTSDGLVHSLQDNEYLRGDRDHWEQTAHNLEDRVNELETQLRQERGAVVVARNDVERLQDRLTTMTDALRDVENKYVRQGIDYSILQERIATLEERVKENARLRGAWEAAYAANTSQGNEITRLVAKLARVRKAMEDV